MSIKIFFYSLESLSIINQPKDKQFVNSEWDYQPTFIHAIKICFYGLLKPTTMHKNSRVASGCIANIITFIIKVISIYGSDDQVYFILTTNI